MPLVRLFTCKPGAVDPGLLSGTYTDGLSVLSKAYRVGLGVLESDQGYYHIADCRLGKFFVLSNYLGEQFSVYFEVVVSLFEHYAVYLLCLDLRANIFRIHLDDGIVSLFL